MYLRMYLKIKYFMVVFKYKYFSFRKSSNINTLKNKCI